MKVCRLCSERYREHVDFCFQDGEVLVAESAVGASAPLDDLDAPPPPRRPAGQAESPRPRHEQAAQPPQPQPQPQRSAAPESDPIEAGPSRSAVAAGVPAAPVGASRVPEPSDDDRPLTAAEQVTIPLPKPGAKSGHGAQVGQGGRAPVKPRATDAAVTSLPPQVQQRRGPQPETPAGTEPDWAPRARGMPLMLIGGVLAAALVALVVCAGSGGAAALLGAGTKADNAALGTPLAVPAVAPAPAPEPEPEPEPGAVEPAPVEPAAVEEPVEMAVVPPTPVPVAPPVPVVAPPPAPVVAPAPAGPTSGIVSFSSVPPGAELRVDDRSVGRTPGKIDLPVGKHGVAIALQGFQTWTGSVDVKGGKQDMPVVKLVPAAPVPAPAAAPAPAPASDVVPAREGKVYLSYAEPGAKVWVDGVFKGALPLMLIMTGGSHEFKIESSTGSVTITRTVVLKDQGNTPVFLDKN